MAKIVPLYRFVLIQGETIYQEENYVRKEKGFEGATASSGRTPEK
jgi:hypothetical protein